MKKYILTIWVTIFLFSCFSSCTKEVSPINDKVSAKVLSSNQYTSGIRYIVLDGDTLNLESLFVQVDTVLVEKDGYVISNEPLVTRAINNEVIPMTISGYQQFTYTSDKIYNVTFTDDVIDAIGLNHNYTYQCKLYLAQYRVGYPSGMSPVELYSPQCGFKPGQSYNKAPRGYEIQLVPGQNSFVMSTYIFAVQQANEHPISYSDVWAPCRPNDLVWNFGLR